MSSKCRISFVSVVLLPLIFALSSNGGLVRGKVYDAAEPEKGLPGIDIQISWASQDQQIGVSNAKGEYVITVDAAVGTTVHATYGGGGYGILKVDIPLEREEIERNVGLVRPKSDDSAYWAMFIEKSSSPSDRTKAWQMVNEFDISTVAKITFSKVLVQTAPEAVTRYPELKLYSDTKLADAKLLDAIVQAALDQKNRVPEKQEVINKEPSVTQLPNPVVADVFADNLEKKDKRERVINIGLIGDSWGPDIQTRTNDRILRKAVLGAVGG